MYENVDKNLYTPMMRQYLEIKEEYPDTLIFYRIGDFYEMFFNDAIVASKELEIVLTGRDAGVKDRVPMCGVPHHAVNAYLDKLSEKGYKVAIVEQLEDPKLAKGLVTRDVVKIVTPGTVTEGNTLDEKENNYLVSLSIDKERYILSYCDLSTGENYLTDLPLNDEVLFAEIIKLKTREIVVSDDFNQNIFKPLKNFMSITVSTESNDTAVGYLSSLSDGLDKQEEKNFSRLLNYIIRTQKKTLVHMQKVIKYDINGFLKIDLSSRRNLELLETLRFQNKKNTLLNVLDKCSTAMGSRYLRKNITFPLINKEKISRRFDIIDSMKKHFLEAEELKKLLEDVYDLERIVGKISYESVNPKDLLQLKKSLSVVPTIKKLVEKMKINDYFDFESDFSQYMSVYQLLDDSISPDAPFSAKDGGVIKKGYNEKLDELMNINSDSKEYLLSLEQRERERTGIKNLKVGFNKVFGYYIEISKGSCPLVKDEFGYIRKQTLTTGERFITQELKEKETMILRAEEKMLELDYNIFCDVRNKCKEYAYTLQVLAKTISELDMMGSFTRVTKENNYVRPSLNDEHILDIKNGRHPVIERYIDNYIPNDIKMLKDTSILLITGPNMSGKSTYMRQVALISIMAQIGCFVPATSANLPIFDAIYTRIGAADDIVSGQSTFMVEMNEVNNALKSATVDSLILFDEIGRGTATYDGMALAQAILEYVHEKIGCKTLFSTHYHELTALENDLSNLENVHVSAEDINGEIVFMHKVKKGAVDKSYGINVAKLANIPLDVILRAEDILYKLQSNQSVDGKLLSVKNYQPPMLYDSKTEQEKIVLDKIRKVSIYEMSPLDAMNLLDELKKILK